jgi:hypothetical protein
MLVVVFAFGASGCSDTASINEEARLSSLTIDPGALQPAFSPNNFDYRVDVPTATDSIIVTATPQDGDTTITINGVPTGSGGGRLVPLAAPGSSTTIRITLSAPSGTQNTYIVLVNRPMPLSSNNNLSALSVSSGNVVFTLDRPFAPGTLDYTVNVDSTVGSVTVSATKVDPNAAMTGSVTAGAGQASGQAPIMLNGAGSPTPISITVTAPNGNAREYRITVNRLAPSSNNNLRALAVTPGTLIPNFSPSTPAYTVVVDMTVGSVVVSATKADPDAVMSALGSVIAPKGIPIGQVTISPGQGPVSIIVVAPDGSQKIYTISVVVRPFR